MIVAGTPRWLRYHQKGRWRRSSTTSPSPSGREEVLFEFIDADCQVEGSSCLFAPALDPCVPSPLRKRARERGYKTRERNEHLNLKTIHFSNNDSIPEPIISMADQGG